MNTKDRLADNKIEELADNKMDAISLKGKGYSRIKTRRTQSGHIHVCLIGCSRFIVFYKDQDYIMFLKILNEYAGRQGTIITEIVLMTNHVHILMLTKNVTKFMRLFLNAYVKWYNRSHSMQGRLFKSPFLSSAKFTKDMVIRSQLYILKNPLKAGLCKGLTANYLWSSYGAHFGGKCYLSNFLKVDTSLFDSFFKSKWYLDKAIHDADFSPADIFETNTSKTALQKSKEIISKELKSKEQLSRGQQPKNLQLKNHPPMVQPLKAQLPEVQPSGVQPSGEQLLGTQPRTSINNYELCKIAMRMTSGRSIFQLSLNEMKELIVRLKEEIGANSSQIASLTHTPVDFVMKVVREFRYMKQRGRNDR